MSAPTSTSTDRTLSTADRLAAPLAMLLWVLVLAGLTYGVLSTLSKVTGDQVPTIAAWRHVQRGRSPTR